MKTLKSRLTDAMALLVHAEQIMSTNSQDDDGKARSLLNDLRWLRDRYVDRLRIEQEIRTNG
ncbi:hypothetical protein BPNPMPFG_000867 [Mesorhizobium sp. AR07]|uniref:hypothetical protein n=1 Tax=Mesorhizobium sp. AR07 TaxID=2865838 RepID=UPI00215F333F|nr:hypothetical protein [Mesorhizobium sp. AR07]UVK45340.1 hypothetical protein BPNPMPFG_000867 [Mesorhizobium sp. AR07]